MQRDGLQLQDLGPEPQRGLRRGLWCFALLALGALIAVILIERDGERTTLQEGAQRETDNLARAFAHHAARTLGDEHRESLHLLFYEGLSVAEIAEIQGVPDGTVETRVFHAKKKIKACLARWLQATGEVVKDALTGGPGPLHPDAAHG